MQYSEHVVDYVKKYSLERLFPFKNEMPRYDVNHSVDATVSEPYPVHWHQVIQLHQLILDRKISTVLEFGVGCSTVIMADAIARVETEHGDLFRQELRNNNAFEIHSVDNEARYIGLTKENLPEELRKFVHFHESRVRMGTFNDRVCTYYENLPNLSPTLIYLDGPHQFNVQGDVRGLSTEHKDRMPMAADILAFEHFLQPSTMIVVDGRAANARFLRCNLQRNWLYKYNEELDTHFLELKEAPLGRYNRRQIELTLGQAWLSEVPAM